MTQDGPCNPPPRTVTETARMQFLSCFQMLQTLVDVCPEEVWRRQFHGLPFWRIADGSLAAEALADQLQYTYADIIFSQVRHAMYNIGYLNGILRSLGLEESDWYAYNEEE